MDVMRTGVSALGCVEPEKDDHNVAGAREIADRLMASLGSMLLYWHHFAHSGKRIEVETDDDSIGGHLLHLLHGREPSAAFVRAMHTSLNLYAEHEFNASTFTAASSRHSGRFLFRDYGGIGALRGPSTAAPTNSPSRCKAVTRRRMRPKPTSAHALRRRR
jgi:2-methylcitrate synthase